MRWNLSTDPFPLGLAFRRTDASKLDPTKLNKVIKELKFQEELKELQEKRDNGNSENVRTEIEAGQRRTGSRNETGADDLIDRTDNISEGTRSPVSAPESKPPYAPLRGEGVPRKPRRAEQSQRPTGDQPHLNSNQGGVEPVQRREASEPDARSPTTRGGLSNTEKDKGSFDDTKAKQEKTMQADKFLDEEISPEGTPSRGAIPNEHTRKNSSDQKETVASDRTGLRKSKRSETAEEAAEDVSLKGKGARGTPPPPAEQRQRTTGNGSEPESQQAGREPVQREASDPDAGLPTTRGELSDTETVPKSFENRKGEQKETPQADSPLTGKTSPEKTPSKGPVHTQDSREDSSSRDKAAASNQTEGGEETKEPRTAREPSLKMGDITPNGRDTENMLESGRKTKKVKTAEPSAAAADTPMPPAAKAGLAKKGTYTPHLCKHSC